MSDGIRFCGSPEPITGGAVRRQNPDASWWLAGTLPGIPASDLKACVQRAFDAWSLVAGVSGREALSADRADLVLATGQIDGPLGILAQCELPGPPIQHAWIDLSERWVIHLGAGVPQGLIDLERVLTHEFGHFWGLEHSQMGSGNLMDPTYSLSVDRPRPGDAREMVSRYGVARLPPVAPPAPVPTEGAVKYIASLDASGRELSRYEVVRRVL